MAMSLGEKAVLTITSDFGYGPQGAGGVIPPNADLRFEVELLAVQPRHGLERGAALRERLLEPLPEQELAALLRRHGQR